MVASVLIALIGSALAGSSAASAGFSSMTEVFEGIVPVAAVHFQHRFLQGANTSMIDALQNFDDGLQTCAATEDMFELNCDANPSMRAADLVYNFASSNACSLHSPYMTILAADGSDRVLASGSRAAGGQLEVSYTYPADSTAEGTIVGRVRVMVGWTESSGVQSQHSGLRFVFDAQCTLRADQVEHQTINENPDVILGSKHGEGTIPVSMRQFVNRRNPTTGQETNFYGQPQDQQDRPGFEVSFANPSTDPSLAVNIRNIRAVFGDGRPKVFLTDGERKSADLLGLQYSDTTRSAHFVLEPQLEAHSDNRPTWLAVDVLVTKDRPEPRLGIGPGQANPTAAQWRENVGLGSVGDDNGRRHLQIEDSTYLAASQVGPTGNDYTVSGSYALFAPSAVPRASSARAVALSAVVSVATFALAV